MREGASDQKLSIILMTNKNVRFKRPFDLIILVVSHLTPLFWPIWILLWTLIPLAIWLEDRGPIFYRQRRLGKGGRVFNVIKFRTMVVDAEKKSGPVWATEGDPRITRVGRFLRRTAMDELPQVINILKGEMSFVGPRSERPEMHEGFVQEGLKYQDRLQVRPGLTGLAQVNGDYNLPPSDKLEYDLEYISTMSLRLDINLILLSIRNTLVGSWDKRSDKKRLPRNDGPVEIAGRSNPSVEKEQDVARSPETHRN